MGIDAPNPTAAPSHPLSKNEPNKVVADTMNKFINESEYLVILNNIFFLVQNLYKQYLI